ncbi:hypothetical protein [Phytomonospora endophytica]|uniref:Uncharacterized protein n=1 Tax=Phytomonospora endophytica TaxID=714109 RepID=A0A841FX76_9ACTN|nr:hypothetical protein [Phytomonospora endophytica]MBB6038338.1 hypothetical protein [Phytomonospora endophytica]
MIEVGPMSPQERTARRAAILARPMKHKARLRRIRLVHRIMLAHHRMDGFPICALGGCHKAYPCPTRVEATRTLYSLGVWPDDPSVALPGQETAA